MKTSIFSLSFSRIISMPFLRFNPYLFLGFVLVVFFNSISGQTACISGTQMICQGYNADLTVSFTGTAPYDFDYSDGSNPTTITGITTGSYIISVSPTVNTTYTLTSMSDANGPGSICPGSSTAIVTIQSGPTGVLSSSQTLCQGNSTNISVTLTGTSPWDISYSEGTTPTVVSGITSSPYLIQVTPSNTTTYTLNDVSDASNNCIYIGNSIILTVNSLPTASLSSSQSVCPNQPTNLTVTLTGTGPWNIDYSDGTNTTTISGIGSSPHVFSVTPTQATTYSIVSITDLTGCTSTVTSTISISTYPPPSVTLSGSNTILCPNVSSIQLDFAISSGTQPWTLTYMDGTNPITVTGISTSPYIVNVSPTTRTSYTSVLITDALGCTGSGNSWVVDPRPFPTAAFASATQTICPNASTSVNINFTGSGPWSYDYTDGTNSFTHSGISVNPIMFQQFFTPPSTTFTITSVSDAYCTNSSVNSTLVVSSFPAPSGTISANQTICNGGTVSVSFNLSGGTQPWDIDYTVGGPPIIQVTGLTTSPYVLTTSLTTNTTFIFRKISDANNCQTNVLDTSVVTISTPTASLSSSHSICQDPNLINIGTNLTVTLTGNGPWDVTYTDGSNPVTLSGISSSPHVFSVTPSQTTTYSLTNVVDVFGCTSTPSSSVVVSVTNYAIPTLSAASTIFCSGSGTTLSFGLGGSPNFNLEYTDGSTPTIVNGITASPYVISVSPNATTSYSVVSLIDANGCPTNPNNNVSQVITVGSIPVVSLNSTGTILCQNISNSNTIDLTFTISSGTPPWTLSYSQGTVPVSITGITSSPYVVTVSPSTRTSYTSVQVTDALGCIGNGNSWTIDPRPFPDASFASSSQTICQSAPTNVNINFTGTSPWTINYSDGTSNYTLTGITANPYVFSVTPSGVTTYTINQVSDAYCTNSSLSPSPTLAVSLFPQPTGSLSSSQTICNGGVVVLSFNVSGGTQPWAITYNDGTNPQNVTGLSVSPYLLNITATANATYAFNKVMDSNGCIANIHDTATITVYQPNGSISGDNSICAGSTGTLSIGFTGSSPWSFNYSDGTSPVTLTGLTQNPYLMFVSPSVSTTYTLVSVTDVNNCSQTINTTWPMTVVPVPTAALSGPASPICAGSPIQLTVALTGSPNWNLTYTDGTNPVNVTGISASPYLIDVTPGSASSYSIPTLTDNSGCSGNTSGIVVVRGIPTASLSCPGTICAGGSMTTINITLLGTAPWTIQYSDGTNTTTVSGITASPYSFQNMILSTTTYSVVQISDQFCTNTNPNSNCTISAIPRPTASISAVNSICSGSSTLLTISLTGVPSYDISYSDGSSNISITGITSSLYTFSVTPTNNTTYTGVLVFDNNCQGFFQNSQIVTLTPLPTASLSGSGTICSGTQGQLTVSLTGVAPWNFTYTSGTTTQSVSGIMSSPYLLNVTPIGNTTYTLDSVWDANCANSSGSTYAYQVTALPTVSLSCPGSICTGNTADLTFTLTGSSPWIIQYSDGTSSQTVSGITASPYIVQVTPVINTTYIITQVSDGFCTNLSQASSCNITVHPTPTAAISGTATICSGDNTLLSVSLTGSQPFNFTYTDGMNNTSITGINASTRTVSVTPSVTTTYTLVSVSGAGCSGSVSGSAIVDLVSPPALSLSSNQPVCVGGTLNISVSGYRSGSTFAWSGPSSFNSTALVAQIVNVVTANAGVYTLVVTDPICVRQLNDTISVSIHQTITGATTGSNTPVCATQTLNLTTSSFVGATYSWSGPNGFTSTSQNPNIPLVTTAASGQYTVVINSPTCGTSQTLTTSVTINAQPTITPGSNSPICQGNSLSLTMHTVSGATSYTWTGPNSFTATTMNSGRNNSPIANHGVYTMTVNTSNCGTITATTMVNVGVTLGNINLYSNSPVCAQSNIMLSINNTANYNVFNGIDVLWQGPNSFTSNSIADTIVSVTAANAGIYTATLTSNMGCTGPSTRVVTIVVNDPATFTCGSYPEPICTGSALYLSSQGPGGTTVVWSGPASFSSSTLNPSRPTTLTTFQGVYTVIATIPGCTGTTSCTRFVTVNAGTKSTHVSSNSPVCLNNTLNLSASNSQSQGVVYSWSGPNSFASSSQYPTIGSAQPVNAGSYIVTITSPGCWSDTKGVNVVINDPASLTATWTSPVCSGSTLALQGSGNNATGFNWSGPASFSSTSQNPNRSNMQTSFQGIYTLTATIPGCGTVSTTTSSVTITCREGRTLDESDAEILQQEENAEFDIWPNPITETNFNLQMPGNQQPDRIYLINMLGQKIEISEVYVTRTQEDLWRVEIPAYIGSGKYILLVETANNRFRESLLILKD